MWSSSRRWGKRAVSSQTSYFLKLQGVTHGTIGSVKQASSAQRAFGRSPFASLNKKQTTTATSFVRSYRLFPKPPELPNPVPGMGFNWFFLWGTVALIGTSALVNMRYRSIYRAIADAPSSLNPNDFVEFPLAEVKEVTHDTKIFRFSLPTPDHELGLPVASCLVTRFTDSDGKPIVRPYTPTSTEHQKGHFDLLVKNYPQGVMSKHIHDLKPGDKLQVKGPIPKLSYKANMKKEIGMLAGGTGITPMYQLLQKILSDSSDKTKVKLVFCNKSTDDILLKKELDNLAKKHKNFEVYYMVDKVYPKDKSWSGGVGFITPDIVKKHIPAPSADTLVLVCGPPGFYSVLSGQKTPDYQQGELTGILKDLGYTKEQVFKF